MSKENDDYVFNPDVTVLPESIPLRDWLAGMALRSMPAYDISETSYAVVAEACYEMADIFLKKREKASESKPDDLLIAVAPEMFEICEELRKMILTEIEKRFAGDVNAIYMTHDKANLLLEKLQAIIRKAKGEEDG